MNARVRAEGRQIIRVIRMAYDVVQVLWTAEA